MQYVGSKFLHAFIAYPPLPDYLLQVDEAAALEFGVILESPNVIVAGSANLENLRIGKNLAQLLGHTQPVYPEKESPVRT